MYLNETDYRIYALKYKIKLVELLVYINQYSIILFLHD